MFHENVFDLLVHEHYQNDFHLHTVVYLLCLGSVNMCSSISNASKESGGLTSLDPAGSILVDNVMTNARSEQVDYASSAVDSELVSHVDAHSFGETSCESSIQGTQCAEEGGILQGRVAREPIDRARYVVVGGTSGTMFACSRCSKQYIHRKSLNKHWNDKHAVSSIDGGKQLPSRTCIVSEPLENLFSVALVRCPSDANYVALSCGSSLITSTVHSYAVCSPTYCAVPVANSRQKIQSDLHRSPTKCRGTVRDSVLWHSLAAIHLNQERDLNSFYSAPMPAHIGGHHRARGSFLDQMCDDDDCHVLDLSKGSSDVHELPNISVPDAPLDLSLKPNSVCFAGSETSPVSLHGIVETVSKSAAGYCKEISAVETPVLNKPKRAASRVAKFGDSMKDSKPAQSDSVAVLRCLHSGILTNATNQSVPAGFGSRSAVAFVADELKSDHAEVEPSAKYKRYPNTAHFENNVKAIAKVPDKLATLKETHDFFGGISRGGHIRCKTCDFSATSMLLFSRHVARHTRKPNVSSATCDGEQNQCGDSIDRSEKGFFKWLGLYRTAGADSEQKLSDRCHYAEVDSLDIDEYVEEYSYSRCKAVVTDVSRLSMPEVEANGFGSGHDDESVENNSSSYSVRRKLGRYQRGLGLTTTESRDAAGRSWRRRRLRTCERCGYVTDNLTTLKRHELKHGALGMYRCKLCDYTVNQQHILEYHTRNVHRLSRQIGPANSTLSKHADAVGEHCDRTTAMLVGDDHEVRLSEHLSETVSAGDSPIRGTFTCSSQVAEVRGIQCAVNRCRVQKIVQYPTSVTVARRHLLNAFGLQIGRGVCVRCGFRSLSSVMMKLHMLRHPHERYTCSVCSHTSPTAQLLLKHKRQHADCGTGHLAQKKTYQCPECPFHAASPHRLQCHTQFHGVKFRHVCGKCSYSVDRANLIAQHRRLHATASVAVQKQNWLHCSKCPFKTINRVALVNHERGHYAVNCQYMCRLCSFGTDVSNVALGHQRLHSCDN